jgi:hypothetical protein
VDLAIDELDDLTALLGAHGFMGGSVHFAIVAQCRKCP